MQRQIHVHHDGVQWRTCQRLADDEWITLFPPLEVKA